MMKLLRANARVLLASITIACAIIAAVVISYVRDDADSHASRAVAQQHARDAAAQFVSGIGPNTTVHEVIAEHVDHPVAAKSFQAHFDSKTETWEAFGADGYLTSMYAVTTDLAGQHVYSTQVFTGPVPS